MSVVRNLYRPSLATVTDLYELTMAAGYDRVGLADREAVFTLAFRELPFDAGYAIAAGLDDALEILSTLHFDADDLAHLASLRGDDDEPLFDAAFLERLGSLRFRCDVDAIPEGTVVFPHEPLVRVRGPLLDAQIVESVLLTVVGFQTLVATKASRIVEAAGGDPVLEFGVRRAQGIDGALSASRASFIGGASGTSDVLAGRLYGIPVRGTHAHSWVQAIGDEQAAFDAYAGVLPNNVVLLVDTYETLDGVRHAIETGRRLRERGRDLMGIRLDSGDLAYLSIEARRMLDDAGFVRTRILASNDLDEHTITSLKLQGARVDTWGVGTRLATAFDQPALGAVYKLTAIREPDGSWRYPVKLSEQASKVSIPGMLAVRRFSAPDGLFRADAIYDETLGLPERSVIVDPADTLRRRRLDPSEASVDIVEPALRDGRRLAPAPALEDIRARARAQVARLHPGIRRLLNPHTYPVGLEEGLHDRRTRLVLEARGVLEAV